MLHCRDLLVIVNVLGALRIISGVRWQDIKFGKDGSIPGLIAGHKPGSPAVIVIQEWWGIDPNIKKHAAHIAMDGRFRVLIPDLYKGKKGVTVEEAQHLMSELDFPTAVEEILEAVAYLKAEGAPRIGIVGFCMGGALTLGALAASDDLVCGAPFYGVNFDLFDIKKLANKPIQGHFGALDTFKGFSDKEAAEKLKKALEDAGNKHQLTEIFIYDDVGHGFMNDKPAPFKSFDERKEKLGFPPFNKMQVLLAWSHLELFLAKSLHIPGEVPGIDHDNEGLAAGHGMFGMYGQAEL